MNSELASFFDNDGLLFKVKNIWSPFVKKTYEVIKMDKFRKIKS